MEQGGQDHMEAGPSEPSRHLSRVEIGMLIGGIAYSVAAILWAIVIVYGSDTFS